MFTKVFTVHFQSVTYAFKYLTLYIFYIKSSVTLGKKEMIKMKEQGDIIKRLDASPTKRVILNKSLVADFPDAIVEIIDNTIDFWREKGYDRDLKIDVNTNKVDLIEISWNMGLPEERWEPLVKVAAPQHVSTESIGMWGEGFKIAIFAMGREINIYSKLKNETINISYPKNWLDTPSWEVFVHKELVKKIPEDSSLVEIHSLVRKQPTESPIIDRVSKTFGTLMKIEAEQNHIMKIYVNGKEVKPKTWATKEDIEENFAFIPGYEPTEHIFGEVDGVEVKMIIGLLAIANKAEAGVYLYGNDRLFAEHLRDETVGFGERVNSIIPGEHPHGMRLQVHFFFNGSPDMIPWNAPLKYGFNVKSPMADEIQRWVKDFGQNYIHFVKNTKASEILPYSKKWTTLSAEKKKEELFRGAVDKRHPKPKQIEDEWKNAPAYIKNGIDVKNRIDVWDHGMDENPPAIKAKWDWVLTKGIAKIAQSQRETGNIGAIELNKRIVESAGQTIEGAEIRASILSQVTDESTTPISTRINSVELTQLRIDTGAIKPSEVLNIVLDAYKKLQKIKRHPYFKDIEIAKNDDDSLMKTISKILDGLVKK